MNSQPRELQRAIAALLEQVQGRHVYRPLTEEQLVSSAIELANHPTVVGLLPMQSEELEQAMADAMPALERFRADARVRATHADLTDDTDEIMERATRAASRVVLVPHYTVDRGVPTVTHRYVAEDLDAVLGYVTLLLFDRDRDCGNRLCICKLEGCGRLFWERRNPSGGPPARLFCSVEHMQQANGAQNAERVRKHREKKRRAKRVGKSTK